MIISLTGLCPTLNCLCPTPSFEKLFSGVKVWRRAQKIGLGRKTIQEIDPRIQKLQVWQILLNWCQLCGVTTGTQVLRLGRGVRPPQVCRVHSKHHLRTQGNAFNERVQIVNGVTSLLEFQI